jgi:hypothetical protein
MRKGEVMYYEMRDISKRVNELSTKRQNADAVCKKLNAEFHASFYANKNDVWVSYMENGKPQCQNLGTFI